MKKITAIIAVLSVASVLAFTGCQKKEEAPQPAAVEQPAAPASAVTSTETATAPAAAPEAAPEHK